METAAEGMGRGEDAIRRHVQRALRELMTDNRPHTEIPTVPRKQNPCHAPGWSSQRLRWTKLHSIVGAWAYSRCHARRPYYSDQAQSRAGLDVRLGLLQQLAIMCAAAFSHKESSLPASGAKAAKGLNLPLDCPNGQNRVGDRCVPVPTRDASLPALNDLARDTQTPAIALTV